MTRRALKVYAAVMGLLFCGWIYQLVQLQLEINRAQESLERLRPKTRKDPEIGRYLLPAPTGWTLGPLPVGDHIKTCFRVDGDTFCVEGTRI